MFYIFGKIHGEDKSAKGKVGPLSGAYGKLEHTLDLDQLKEKYGRDLFSVEYWNGKSWDVIYGKKLYNLIVRKGK